MNKFHENEFFSLYSGANINGDDVIGFAAPSKIKAIQGYLDKPSVLEAMFNKYDNESHKTHLGMIELIATVQNVRLPMMMDLLKTSSVLTIQAGGSVTYDLPIPRDPQDVAHVIVDTSTDNENGAIYADIPFKLILDRPYTAGDLLKPDPTGVFQVEISRDIPVEPYAGGAYLHYAIFKAPAHSKRTFPTIFLKEGAVWFKIGHKNGEYGTQFSTVQLEGTAPAYMTLQWTPSSLTTIETAITREAARMSTNGAKLLRDKTLDNISEEMIKLGGFDNRGVFLSGKTIKQDNNYKLDPTSIRVDSTLEYIAMAELHKMEAWTNMFATAQVDHGTEGVIKVNDGLWRQYRRGKIIEYTRPGGITLSDLAEASNYYFGNSTIPANERRIKFKGGYQAYLNGINLLQRYAVDYLSTLPTQMMGADALLSGNGQKLVTGNLDELTLNTAKFTNVLLPGVGYVTFEHDPSFDWNFGTQNAKVSGFVAQGFNRNTYTLIVDTTNANSGRAIDKVKGMRLVNGGKEDSPIYLVQPDEPYITWGRTQGRMNNGAQYTNVQSALKYMAQEFWAYADSDVLLLDTTRCVILELKDTYLYE